ncbi:glycosyltransferase [Branchiibius sp. NY16-3462-2]|uniref:glycosyltransferase n=1 Tax=Branchiibius sp. NY16-3462-2 TaxID=1807500 RepID=UPI00079C8402|nr:glycosyltransferase [Branchiibius sp. NY16-3462-2]KYH43583.1 hypothetical protein AZH51_03765 [Branchiibius sp. NY16-3462-2]
MIGFYVHHVGGGHLARATQIARELHCPITGLSTLPRPDGWPGEWLQLPPDDPAEDDTAAPEAQTDAGGALHFAPLRPGFRARQRAVAQWVLTAAPRAVLVDVSVEVAALFRLLAVPVVVTAMPGDRRDRAHRLGYDLASAIIAPWPAAAHPDSVAGGDHTTYVGGISRFAGREPDPQLRETGRALVIWGSGGADLTAAQRNSLMSGAPDHEWVIASDLPPEQLWLELQRAEVVVSHAGQGAVADLAVARAPAVVFADERPHGEQQATVGALRRLGLAVGAPTWPEVGQWPHLLSGAIDVGGRHWSSWLGSGAAGAAQVLREVAA